MANKELAQYITDQMSVKMYGKLSERKEIRPANLLVFILYYFLLHPHASSLAALYSAKFPLSKASLISSIIVL